MRVLAVAAHPDDEVVGAGATLARHAREGHAVDVVICAPGRLSREPTADEIAGLLRMKENAREAARRLGVKAPVFLDFTALDAMSLRDLARRLRSLIGELRPDVLYTHYPGDLDADHQVVARAVLTACRPRPDSALRALHAWETPASSGWAPPSLAPPFWPDHFVDVEATLGAKLNALACYEGSPHAFPHPRSAEALRHLAAVRGAAAGLVAAEAFVTLRSLWR
jgi:LmbE family N-acetylglucosaminyl deacetylase